MAKSTDEAKPDGTITYKGRMVRDPTVQAARCFGCGKIGTPFWDCDCEYAVAVREGKAKPPRMDVAHFKRTGETVLVADQEWIEKSQSGLMRYRDRPKKRIRKSPVPAVTVTEINAGVIDPANMRQMARDILLGNKNTLPPIKNTAEPIKNTNDENKNTGRGRPRKFASPADRERAYRAQKKGKPE